MKFSVEKSNKHNFRNVNPQQNQNKIKQKTNTKKQKQFLDLLSSVTGNICHSVTKSA